MANSDRIIFAGTPLFAQLHLQALIDEGANIVAVYTQPDRPAGRGKKLQPSPVKSCAEAAGLRVLQPQTLKSEAAQAELRALQADIMIVVAYGLILPQSVLDTPRLGCINVHASLLPRWRGAAPIQRAIEAGDKNSGITIMKMEAGLDTGPMLAKAIIEISARQTGGELHDALAAVGPATLIKVLDDFPRQWAQAVEQNDKLANYAHKITKDDCLINWHLPASLLARKIRAFNPAPVCFSQLSDQRVKIWMAEAVDNATPVTPVTPGTIIQADRNGLIVACSEGALNVSRAQFPGGKPLAIVDLLNSRAKTLAPGQRFETPNSDTPL